MNNRIHLAPERNKRKEEREEERERERKKERIAYVHISIIRQDMSKKGKEKLEEVYVPISWRIFETFFKIDFIHHD